MTLYNVVQPVYAIRCDHDECTARFRANGRDSHMEHTTRRAAINAGWTLRPLRGKGSRSAPDLCPDHAKAVPA